ncbi:hypothetical protein EK21DRAFT_114826 [Setomelanomma holmii]|uniref:Uncharacterized protein n=1 Tax=Setomelanomma holmii TaxID=210430 RepID=A0A9P4LJC8_9PLEO|nr:hypothetical protein EK21DRAFT_114826 [Setomelanomma holmii]
MPGHTSNASATACVACTRLGRILACCRKPKPSRTCEDCAAIDALIARELPDPQTARHEKQDRIETLKLQTKAQGEENEGLKAKLVEKNRLLNARKVALEEKVGRNAFKRKIKAIEKARRKH